MGKDVPAIPEMLVLTSKSSSSMSTVSPQDYFRFPPCILLVNRFTSNPHARMGATKDENKDLTDFSLRLCASARDMFFLPQRRRDAESFYIFI
ncbi:MAG: hypothetical protein WA081_06135 [Desulfosalsimonadaceae bacterium]